MLSVRSENSDGLRALSRKIPSDEKTHIKGAATRIASCLITSSLRGVVG